jgi:hypothetical protein
LGHGRHRIAVLAAGICVVVAAAALAVAALGTGTAGDATAEQTVLAVPGEPVPAALVETVLAAARSCPTLTPARLAGQLMAASGFKPVKTVASEPSGIAGLTPVLWKKWAPTTTADREDPAANVLALAHYMCDLVGQSRVAGVSVDLWRAALGAYQAGIEAVRTAKGVPDAALDYVTAVAGYAAWYQQQPQFGGTGAPTPSATATATPASTPTAAPSSSGTAARSLRSATPPASSAPGRSPTPAAAPKLPSVPAGQATGPTISFHVTTPGYTDRYLRHFDSFAITSVIGANSPPLDRQDASYIVRPGLAQSSCYSFESVNYPGRFLRDAYFRVRIDPNDGSALFAVDATFCARAGLSGHDFSFESYGKPGYFLRHYLAELWMSRRGGPYATDSANFYADDTTWHLDAGLAPAVGTP